MAKIVARAKGTGRGRKVHYIVITLQQVFVSSIQSQQGSKDSGPVETLTLSFGTAKTAFT
jgi:type VI protein secretion system component Hcp